MTTTNENSPTKTPDAPAPGEAGVRMAIGNALCGYVGGPIEEFDKAVDRILAAIAPHLAGENRDSARLDWLEAHHKIWNCFHANWESGVKTDGHIESHITVRLPWPSDMPVQSNPYNSVRAAIDSAMHAAPAATDGEGKST